MAISPGGDIVFWSPGAQELFGYPCSEAQNRSLLDLIVPQGRLEETRNAVNTTLLTGHISFESVRRKKDGSLVYVDISMQSILDADGRPAFVLIGQRDITRRKQAEGQLRASEERYRRIVETAAEGIWTIDFSGRTSYINPRGAAILGYDIEEMLGRSPLDFTFPEDVSLGMRRLGMRNQGVGEEGDHRMRRKDGREVFVHTFTTPILGEQGEYRGALAMFTDITDRKRAYDALRRFSTIVEQSNEAIISETLDGEILSWNAAATRIFGYASDEMIGKNISLLIPPERQGESRRILESIRRGELVEQHTTVRRRKDGQEIDVSQSVSLIRDTGNAITGASIIVRDITEEKRLREELDAVAQRRAEDLRRFAFSVQQAQEEERRRISRELHDDLGQRLTGLKLKIEVLGEDVPECAVIVTEGLEQVKKGINALLMEVRRISSNLRPSVLDDFGMVAAVRLLCKEFEGSSKIGVRFRGSAVRCGNKDAEIALYRIVQEALSNVSRHAKARSVAVNLAQHGDRIRLVVEDDGRGVDLARRNGNGERKGLGLIGMNERMQLLGGSVQISSSPGHGMRVQVEIPASINGKDEENQNPDR